MLACKVMRRLRLESGGLAFSAQIARAVQADLRNGALSRV
jgi:hypothetical protein